MISFESCKYPYNSRIIIENEEFLSDKVCSTVLKIKKNTLRIIQIIFICSNLNFVREAEAIGFPLVPSVAPRMRSVSSNQLANQKRKIIQRIIETNSKNNVFSELEIGRLYDIAFECIHNPTCITFDQILLELRGGDITNDLKSVLELLAVLISILAFLNNLNIPMIDGFNVFPGIVIKKEHQAVDPNNKPRNDFQYGKTHSKKSLIISELTATAGSEQNIPSSNEGFLNYNSVMKYLQQNKNKKKFFIQIEDITYSITNKYLDSANELQFVLAEDLYTSIRNSNTDVLKIAKALGFKIDNIQKIKDHVFYNKHKFDRYKGEEIEYKRFDANLKQALAWKRLETGKFSTDDIVWLKHEFAEQYHEFKHNAGYSESHNRAQNMFDGEPWKNDCKPSEISNYDQNNPQTPNEDLLWLDQNNPQTPNPDWPWLNQNNPQTPNSVLPWLNQNNPQTPNEDWPWLNQNNPQSPNPDWPSQN
jgi:hypothetical protein